MSVTCAQAGRSISFPSNQMSRREIRSLNRWKHTSEKGLEEMLSSTLLAGDKDLPQVLDEWTIFRKVYDQEHETRLSGLLTLSKNKCFGRPDWAISRTT